MCYGVSYTTAVGGIGWGLAATAACVIYIAGFVAASPAQWAMTLASLACAQVLTIVMKRRQERLALSKATLEASGRALRQAEQYFRQFAAEAPAPMWLADPDGNRYFFNQSWTALTGRGVERESGKGWIEGVHPSDAASVYTFLTSVRQQTAYRVDYRLRAADGQYRWIRESAGPRCSPAGAGFVGVCWDVTEEKQTQAALEDCESRFHNLFEQTPAAYLEIDAAGIVRRANPAACQALAKHPDAVIGGQMSEVTTATAQSWAIKNAHGEITGRLVALPVQAQSGLVRLAAVAGSSVSADPSRAETQSETQDRPR
jgi:PAS domain S-box-containing protein